VHRAMHRVPWLRVPRGLVVGDGDAVSQRYLGRWRVAVWQLHRRTLRQRARDVVGGVRWHVSRGAVQYHRLHELLAVPGWAFRQRHGRDLGLVFRLVPRATGLWMRRRRDVSDGHAVQPGSLRRRRQRVVHAVSTRTVRDRHRRRDAEQRLWRRLPRECRLRVRRWDDVILGRAVPDGLCQRRRRHKLLAVRVNADVLRAAVGRLVLCSMVPQSLLHSCAHTPFLFIVVLLLFSPSL
jgi:hypothetical protein